MEDRLEEGVSALASPSLLSLSIPSDPPAAKAGLFCATSLGITFFLHRLGVDVSAHSVLHFHSLCCSSGLVVSHQEGGRPRFRCGQCTRLVPRGLRPAIALLQQDLQADREDLEARFLMLLDGPYPVLLAGLLAEKLTEDVLRVVGSDSWLAGDMGAAMAAFRV